MSMETERGGGRVLAAVSDDNTGLSSHSHHHETKHSLLRITTTEAGPYKNSPNDPKPPFFPGILVEAR